MASTTGRTSNLGVASTGAPKTGRTALPNLIVIGAMKCGTSSLHRYLNLHPAVSMSRVKELDFFIEARAWGRGVAWYAGQFDAAASVRGESSPNYTDAHAFLGVPARMACVVPDAKLIYIVRDPIQRLIAQHVHHLSMGIEHRSFAEVCRKRSYIERSMYWFQIKKYLAYFEASQILVVETEDLLKNRRDTMHRVFEFVGVQPELCSSSLRKEYNKTARKRQKTRVGSRLERTAFGRVIDKLPQPWRRYVRRGVYLPLSRPIERPTLTERQRLELVQCLRDDAAQFRAWTGCQFPAWSV